LNNGDPGAYGTLTLWNTQIHELYSPFKAHTITIKSWGFGEFRKIEAVGKSV